MTHEYQFLTGYSTRPGIYASVFVLPFAVYFAVIFFVNRQFLLKCEFLIAFIALIGLRIMIFSNMIVHSNFGFECSCTVIAFEGGFLDGLNSYM